MMTLYEFFKEEAEIMGKYANGELVEVVRCKDCIDWDKEGFCGITGREEPESHYCSYGERREE